jgi:hypothetical protein
MILLTALANDQLDPEVDGGSAGTSYLDGNDY